MCHNKPSPDQTVFADGGCLLRDQYRARNMRRTVSESIEAHDCLLPFKRTVACKPLKFTIQDYGG